MKRQDGITLIALVITIIVLLILAAVSIATISGENGLFNKAQSAKLETEKKIIEEQRNMARLEALTSLENREYVDKNGDIAMIPAGFCVTGIEGENTVDEGLVIIDYAGNEFVWVPVDKNNFESDFVRIAGYANGSLQSISGYGEADATGVNSNVSGGENDETKQEAIAMYESVKKYGGFYIGRYEAGKETETLDDGTIKNKAVVKKGAELYNYIQWGKGMKDTTGGAVEAARNFAIENEYGENKVHSTLCYSVQWDTAIKFIDPNYTGYAKDSTKQGWFSDNYNDTSTGNIDTNPNHITGKDLIYNDAPTKIANKHKNIYDLGGNAREWVMESTGGYRCVRGGYYKGTGLYRSSSNRTNSSWGDKYEYIGFRITLYLE